MKTLTLSTLILFFLSIVSTAVHAQNVTIPDANFKAYLVGNAAINTNGDTEIQVGEASAFTGGIIVPGLSIADLTGIEAFINITLLWCSNNQLTNLDMSANTALTELQCALNPLMSLDVSANIALTNLYCANNQLTNLDLSTNTALSLLSCFDNPLTNLNLTTSTALTELYCWNDSLTSLDLSANTALLILYCNNNQLTSLNLTTNTALTELYCTENQLTSLNIANGNNTNIITSLFDATNNPNLSCIQVDDVVYSTTTWTNIDSTASFSTFCTPVSINKLEDNKLTNVQVYPNPTSKNVSINLNKNYKEITILVTNTIGQVILSKQYTEKQFINLDLERNSGVYFVTILTEEGTSKTKVIKA
jgi:hypothetical protein